MTLSDEEWDNVCRALVRGGLREYLDKLLAEVGKPSPPCPVLSERNRRLLYREYDTGEFDFPIRIVPHPDSANWFQVCHASGVLAEGVEFGGELVCVVPHSEDRYKMVKSGPDGFEDLSDELFPTMAETRAYIKGLMS